MKDIETNPYRFIAIDEAIEIHCSFLCVKNASGEYIMKDNDLLISCCKIHVSLKGIKDQDHIDMLNYYLDNTSLLY